MLEIYFSKAFNVAVLGILLYAVYWILQAIVLIFFHPLSRYPGPKLAVADPAWYEWYHNSRTPGRLIYELERLHEKHGPVIRIGPKDLHVNDPEVYQRMTKNNSHLTKTPWFYRAIVLPGALPGLTDASEARTRRQILAPAFSMARVQEHAKYIEATQPTVFQRLRAFAQSNTAVDVMKITNAFTADVSYKIIFGSEAGTLQQPDFQNHFIDHLHTVMEASDWKALAFPNFTKFTLALPPWLQSKIVPFGVMELRRGLMAVLEKYINERIPGKTSGYQESEKGLREKSSDVIDLLMKSASADSRKAPNLDLLGNETITLFAAANDTTSNTLYRAVYEVCQHPKIAERLVQELREVSADKRVITYEEAKQLPYLTAVIKEALRTASPVPGRIPRIVPAEGFDLNGHLIPAGMSLHTSSHLLNRHPSVFPNPNTFDPERWLQPDSAKLDKYLTSFYKGNRVCIGRDLAWAEMWVFLANLWRQFEVKEAPRPGVKVEYVDYYMGFYRGERFHVTFNETD